MTTITDTYRLVGQDATATAFRSAVARSEEASRKITAGFKRAFSAIAVVGFGAMIRSTAAAGDEMLTLAKRTGRTVESLSQLKYVADRGNSSLEALVQAGDQLAKRLGATDEEGKGAVKVLNEIGLSAAKLRSLSPDGKLDAIADAMGRIRDPADRARVAMSLFGKSGAELLPVLTSGAHGIRELREEADRLGITMSTENAERLSKLDDQIEQLGGQLRNAKMELVGLISAPVGGFLDAMAKGFRGWQVSLGINISEVERFGKEIERLTFEQRELRDMQKAGAEAPWIAERLAKIREELALLDEMQQAWLAMPSLVQKFNVDLEKSTAAERAAAEWVNHRAVAYAKLRELVQSIRDSGQGRQGLDPLGDSDAENSRVIAERMHAIMRSNIELRDRTIQINNSISEDVRETTVEVSEHWLEAQRGIQRSFAGFFRNLGKGSGRDLVEGIMGSVRDALANRASAMMMDLLGLGEKSGGGFLGKLLGVGSAVGTERQSGGGTTATVRAAEMVAKIKDSAGTCQCIHEAMRGSSMSIIGAMHGSMKSASGDTDRTIAGVDASTTKAASSINANAWNVGQFLANTMWEIPAAAKKSALIENALGELIGVFSGSFASGGALARGEWGVVGERGPELAYGGAHGMSIAPMRSTHGPSGRGDVHVNLTVQNHIDARGATVELAQRLPGILREVHDHAVARAEEKIIDGIQRGKYRLRL